MIKLILLGVFNNDLLMICTSSRFTKMNSSKQQEKPKKYGSKGAYKIRRLKERDNPVFSV